MLSAVILNEIIQEAYSRRKKLEDNIFFQGINEREKVTSLHISTFRQICKRFVCNLQSFKFQPPYLNSLGEGV